MNITPRPTVFAADSAAAAPAVRRRGAHGLTPETTRSTPARSCASDVGEAGLCNSARVASAWPAPISSASAPPGASSAGASATSRRTRSRPSAPPSSASAGSLRTSAAATASSPRRDVGKVRDDQRERRVRRQRRGQIALDEGDRGAEPLGVRARHLSAAAETSLANTAASARSLASVIASAPEPVPTSAMRGGRPARPAAPAAPAPPRSASRCRGAAPARARRPRTRTSRTPCARSGRRPTRPPAAA